MQTAYAAVSWLGRSTDCGATEMQHRPERNRSL